MLNEHHLRKRILVFLAYQLYVTPKDLVRDHETGFSMIHGGGCVHLLASRTQTRDTSPTFVCCKDTMREVSATYDNTRCMTERGELQETTIAIILLHAPSTIDRQQSLSCPLCIDECVLTRET
jgi:hypothetical protein